MAKESLKRDLTKDVKTTFRGGNYPVGGDWRTIRRKRRDNQGGGTVDSTGDTLESG